MEFFSLSAGDKFPSEAVFLNVYGALESISPAYVYSLWLAGTTNGVVVPARQAGNRFLGSLKGLKYDLCTG